MRFQTDLIHAGHAPDAATGALSTPIYQTTTFVFDDIGENKGYDYSRTGNPTRKVLEDNLAALECGNFGLALPTGMSAETTALSLFKAGDHIICGSDVYGGTVRLLNFFVNHFGFNVSFVDVRNLDEIEKEIRPETKVVWAESPTNPMLSIIDIKAITGLCKEKGLFSIIDNTFLSPYFQKPLNLGADIVVHSTTKYLSGHNDGLGGAIVGRDKAIGEKLAFNANALGNAPGAFDSWLILRGIKTLAVRMKQHQENALALAEYLDNHSAVKKVYFPGLKDHPQKELINRQMDGFGGMLSFEVEGGIEKAHDILRKTKLFYLAESFGGVESLIQHPATMSHASMSKEEQVRAGITDGLIRISTGIEDKNDLLNDLENALNHASKVQINEPHKLNQAV